MFFSHYQPLLYKIFSPYFFSLYSFLLYFDFFTNFFSPHFFLSVFFSLIFFSLFFSHWLFSLADFILHYIIFYSGGIIKTKVEYLLFTHSIFLKFLQWILRGILACLRGVQRIVVLFFTRRKNNRQTSLEEG